MSTVSRSQTVVGQPKDVFQAVCRAIADLGQYEVAQLQEEVLWGHWKWRGTPPSFIEVQVLAEGHGSRVELELRNADLRDRLGLTAREASRIQAHIAAHVQAGSSGLVAVERPPAPVTDRKVIVAAIGAAMVLAVVGSAVQCVMGLFR